MSFPLVWPLISKVFTYISIKHVTLFIEVELVVSTALLRRLGASMGFSHIAVIILMSRFRERYYILGKYTQTCIQRIIQGFTIIFEWTFKISRLKSGVSRVEFLLYLLLDSRFLIPHNFLTSFPNFHYVLAKLHPFPSTFIFSN